MAGLGVRCECRKCEVGVEFGGKGGGGAGRGGGMRREERQGLERLLREVCEVRVESVCVTESMCAGSPAGM